MKTSEISKYEHDRLILMFFSDSLSKNTLKNIENIVIVHSCSKFFSIFYRNAKISTSCTAKSRRDGEKRMSNSDSAAKKTQKMIILINCVFQIFFSVTQCNQRWKGACRTISQVCVFIDIRRYIGVFGNFYLYSFISALLCGTSIALYTY